MLHRMAPLSYYSLIHSSIIFLFRYGSVISSHHSFAHIIFFFFRTKDLAKSTIKATNRNPIQDCEISSAVKLFKGVFQCIDNLLFETNSSHFDKYILK